MHCNRYTYRFILDSNWSPEEHPLQWHVVKEGRFFMCSLIPKVNLQSLVSLGRWQWPRDLRHELSSLDRTLGSWLRIPLNHSKHGCVCMRLFCVCVVLCIGSGLATGLSLVQGVIPSVFKKRLLRNWKRGCKNYWKKKVSLGLLMKMIYCIILT
jgi:hypothetical protein